MEHMSRFITLRQLNEESPPAWVIQDTQLSNFTTGPSGTTLPDASNSGVMLQVGDLRDKKKGRDRGAGFDESTTVSKIIDEETFASTHQSIGCEGSEREGQGDGFRGAGGFAVAANFSDSRASWGG